MNWTCGWDGGGTKTRVLCLSEDGRVLAEETFGPLNLNGSDPERVRHTVQDAVRFMACVEGGACKGLVIGAAGVSNASAVKLLTESAREAGYDGALRAVGDQEAALAGAIEGPGAVLIAGTGAICCGRGANGESARVGGYGYLIDDAGSGYAIGRDILVAVVRAADGRDEPTCLTQAVLDALHADGVSGIITWLYGAGTTKKEVAALAPLLLDALNHGDPAAERIADSASRALAELAETAWRTLRLREGELALTGSILEHYPRIRDGVARRLGEACPAMRVIAPRHSAAYGAALLAREIG